MGRRTGESEKEEQRPLYTLEEREASSRTRPACQLRAGIPDPSHQLIRPTLVDHRRPEGWRLVTTPILNGLHHEHRWTQEAAWLRIILADHREHRGGRNQSPRSVRRSW